MPRDGNGVASKPAGTTATPNTLIESSKFNSVIDDIYALLNAALPITAGGTSAVSKQGAVSALFDGTTIVDDDNFTLAANGDQTKLLAFDLSGLTTATERIWTAPDKDGTVAMIADIIVPRGHIYGLTLANNGTDATNDIDVAAGECATDDTVPAMMVLASAITKRLDAAWAVGTGNGGLDTGTKANSTWYYVWLIGRSDTGVVDVLFSLSSTSPTLPGGYDQKRRLRGAIRTNSGGVILPFAQRGNTVLFATRISDAATTIGTTASLITLTVPPILGVTALFGAYLQNVSSGFSALITSPDETDQVPSSTILSITASTSQAQGGEFAKRVNTSGQIRARSSAASTTLNISTYGFIDEGLL